MRPLLLVTLALFPGCSAISAGLVLTAAESLPGAYAPPPVRCEECEAEVDEADALAIRVPQWMEQSRQRAGSDAKVTRTGYFSWEVSSPSVTSICNVTGRRWRCDKDLEATFSQQL